MSNILHKRTDLLLYITIVLLPLYVIRFSIISLPTTFLECMVGFITISWLCDKPKLIHVLKVPMQLLLALLLLLLGATISLFVSNDIVSAFGTYRAYIIEPLLIFIVSVTTYYSKDKDSRLQFMNGLWKSVVYMSSWLAILGIIQYVFGIGVITEHQFDRAHAVFNNANALALILAPISVVLFKQLMDGYALPFKRKTHSAILVIHVAALLMTSSTGGLLATIIGILLVLCTTIFPNIKEPILLKFIFLSVLSVFILFMLQISQFTYKTDNPWVREGSTLDTRFCVWEGTKELLSDYPFTGGGHRNFQQLYSSSYITCDAEPLVYPHNIFLNQWVETGLLGLVGMLVLFWILFTTPTVFSYFFLVTIIHGLVDVPYYKNDLSILFMILIGLYVMRRNYSDTSSGGE